MAPNFDELRHPDYVRMCARWQMAWDFWRGGIHVLAPDHETGQIRYAIPRRTSAETGGEAATLPRKEQDYEWVVNSGRSWLFKHEKESKDEYTERQVRQVHLPIFQYVVNVFSAGILRSGPDDTPDSGWWRTYYEDVDLAGTSMDAFRRQRLAMALVFGRAHAVTDRPAGQPAVNRAEQLERGERVYSYLVTPLDLVDWRLDARGRFVWAIVRESQPDERAPGETLTNQWSQYRVWTRYGWELYRGKAAVDSNGNATGIREWVLIDSAEHEAGEVPIATTYATKDGRPGTMSCESPLSDVLDFDRSFLNDLSEQNEIDRAQSFGTLCWPERDGGPIGGIDIGPFRAATFPAEAGPPQYISPPSDIASGRWSRSQEKLFVIRQLAGVSRGKAEYSKEERSAASIDLESEDKRNQMAWWAAAMEEGDRQQLRQAGALEKQEDSVPRPRYPRTFDVKGLAQEINELVQLGGVKVLPPKAMATLAKPIVERKLREQGLAEDEIAEALIALEEEGNKEPEPIAAITAPNGMPMGQQMGEEMPREGKPSGEMPMPQRAMRGMMNGRP